MMDLQSLSTCPSIPSMGVNNSWEHMQKNRFRGIHDSAMFGIAGLDYLSNVLMFHPSHGRSFCGDVSDSSLDEGGRGRISARSG